MSTLTADPGFGRGQVLGILWTAYDAVNGDGSNVLGCRKTFLDTNPSTGVLLSNRTVDCICVKNTSGAAILPKTVVQFSLTAQLSSVDASATSTSVLYGVADEYLPAGGVANGEVFWLVVGGPSVATKTSVATTAGASLGVSATAGSVAAGTSAVVGYAIEAAATGTTSVRVQVSTPVR